MFDQLAHWVAGSPWAYPLLGLLTAADIAVVVPADTVVITAVVLALHGPLSVPGIAVAAAAGAAVGDNILYLLGRRVGQPLVDRLFRSDRSRRRLERAREQVHRHDRLLILAGRFVPAGRTATMFAAGLLHVPWPRFIVLELVAVFLWVGYTVLTPVVFGDALSPWATLLLSFGVALLIAGVAEPARRLAERRAGSGSGAGGRGAAQPRS